jgi:methylenetetrahydrofolate reductase (NADPH)
MTALQTGNSEPARAARLAALMRHFSLEATLPGKAELAELRGTVPPRIGIYSSNPPRGSHVQLAAIAADIRAAGFEPVPHIAARTYENAADLDDFLARVRGDAGVEEVLVIAGDRDTPAGPYADAQAVLESGSLQRHGIRRIGISGYPDGHPKIGEEQLWRALQAKLAVARRDDLRVHIVTQFCLEAERILGWLHLVRARGVDVPVRIGLAGPTSMRSLMRFAMRCGVRASLKGMLSGKGLELMGNAAPDEIIAALAASEDIATLGDVSLHFYSFGGLANTGRWANAVATGEIDVLS